MLVLIALLGYLAADLLGTPSGGRRSALAASATQLGPPGTYAGGSCMELQPTTGDRHTTVFLDAGHGGPDPGSTGTAPSGKAVYEKQFTLPVELETASLLRADGYTVVVSRTTDGPVAALGPGDLNGVILTSTGEHVETAARVRCANEAHAAVLVSIHFNAFSDPSAGGALTTYDPSRSFAAASRRLALLLQRDIVSSLARSGWHVESRGVVTDTSIGAPALTTAAASYGHLFILGPRLAGFNNDPSQMPGALVEPLFITDPAETAIVQSTAGRHAIASGIAQAVERFLATSRGA